MLIAELPMEITSKNIEPLELYGCSMMLFSGGAWQNTCGVYHVLRARTLRYTSKEDQLEALHSFAHHLEVS